MLSLSPSSPLKRARTPSLEPPATATGEVDVVLNGDSSLPCDSSRLGGNPMRRIDPNQLRDRLYSYAPKQATFDSKALRFHNITKAQIYRSKIPTCQKLEPLPQLQKYQEQHSPQYIFRKNRENLEKEGKFIKDEPELKKMRRASVIKPLKRQLSSASLGSTPTEKPQVLPQIVSAASRPMSQRGLVHTDHPSESMSTKPKFADRHEGVNNYKEIIKLIRENPKLGFFYLSPCVPKSCITYHYYNLKVVRYDHIYKPDYCSISQKGVTRMRIDDETEFITLDRWEMEYMFFERLVKIPTFYLFRKWKAFAVWRKTVRSRRIQECKKSLNENLFIVNPSLRPAMLNVREMCHKISDMGLCKVERGYTYTLTEFRDAQFSQLIEVSGHLMEFRDLVKEVVRSACRTALLEAGFTPDDYYYDGMDSRGGENRPPGTTSSYMMQSTYDMDIYGEAPEKMTYTEQANKRAHCRRLTCFIRLADYLIVNTMHVLAVNSIAAMLTHFNEQLENTPSTAQIQAMLISSIEDLESKTSLEDKPVKKVEPARQVITSIDDDAEMKQVTPLFITEFTIDPDNIAFIPDLDDFLDGLIEVVKRFQECVLNVSNLVPDTYFDAFTRFLSSVCLYKSYLVENSLVF